MNQFNHLSIHYELNLSLWCFQSTQQQQLLQIDGFSASDIASGKVEGKFNSTLLNNYIFVILRNKNLLAEWGKFE